MSRHNWTVTDIVNKMKSKVDYSRIVFLLWLILPFLGMGQVYTVESFENIPSDLSARTHSRIDNNGRKCGLIKVYVKDEITSTGGSVIGDVIDRGLEKWVYVSHDAKKIQLLFKEHMPLYITFDDFNYPTITGQMTYIINLKEETPVQSSDSNMSHSSGTSSNISDQKVQNQTNDFLTPSEMFEKGYAAVQSFDYQEAVKWYRKAAEQGNASAQNNLGGMYYRGQGVSQNYPEAVKWYRKAAEQGHASSQYNLGLMYDKGQGVSQDYPEAVKWYRKAAEQGNANGQNNLGLMYYHGTGVAKDMVEARKWFEKAAEQGHTKAAEMLKNL